MFEFPMYRIKAKQLSSCTITYLNNYDSTDELDMDAFTFDGSNASIFTDLESTKDIHAIAMIQLNGGWSQPIEYNVYVQTWRDGQWKTVWDVRIAQIVSELPNI